MISTLVCMKDKWGEFFSLWFLLYFLPTPWVKSIMYCHEKKSITHTVLRSAFPILGMDRFTSIDIRLLYSHDKRIA